MPQTHYFINKVRNSRKWVKSDANILSFLWTYLIKDDGTKKAPCVCNGAPSRGTVTLGPTYAGSLDQTGARIFWATAAMLDLRVYGADVSNAFAEATPPVAPLYITVDKQYREWYKAKGYGTISTFRFKMTLPQIWSF